VLEDEDLRGDRGCLRSRLPLIPNAADEKTRLPLLVIDDRIRAVWIRARGGSRTGCGRQEAVDGRQELGDVERLRQVGGPAGRASTRAARPCAPGEQRQPARLGVR